MLVEAAIQKVISGRRGEAGQGRHTYLVALVMVDWSRIPTLAFPSVNSSTDSTSEASSSLTWYSASRAASNPPLKLVCPPSLTRRIAASACSFPSDVMAVRGSSVHT